MAKHAASRRKNRRRRRAVKGLVCFFVAVLLLVGGTAALWHYRADIRRQLWPDSSRPESSVSRSGESHPSAASGSTTTTQPIPEKHLLTGVQAIAQYPEYPTGCESVSAVIAMRYAGSDISIDDFIDDYLDKSDFYTENGVLHGPDPNIHFIGSPRSENAYGCYAPVIEKAMNAYYKDKNRVANATGTETNADHQGKKQVVNATGTDLSALCRQYIARDIPCLVWVSIGMVEPRPSTRWILPNGESFQWLSNEHCMVLMGYDATHYYFSDPYRGAIVPYDRTLSETRYAAFGKQALAITG